MVGVHWGRFRRPCDAIPVDQGALIACGPLVIPSAAINCAEGRINATATGCTGVEDLGIGGMEGEPRFRAKQDAAFENGGIA